MPFITDCNEFKMNPLQEFVYHLLSFVYLCFISRGLEQQEKPWPCRSENLEEKKRRKPEEEGERAWICTNCSLQASLYTFDLTGLLWGWRCWSITDEKMKFQRFGIWSKHPPHQKKKQQQGLNLLLLVCQGSSILPRL